MGNTCQKKRDPQQQQQQQKPFPLPTPIVVTIVGNDHKSILSFEQKLTMLFKRPNQLLETSSRNIHQVVISNPQNEKVLLRPVHYQFYLSKSRVVGTLQRGYSLYDMPMEKDPSSSFSPILVFGKASQTPDAYRVFKYAQGNAKEEESRAEMGIILKKDNDVEEFKRAVVQFESHLQHCASRFVGDLFSKKKQ